GRVQRADGLRAEPDGMITQDILRVERVEREERGVRRERPWLMRSQSTAGHGGDDESVRGAMLPYHRRSSPSVSSGISSRCWPMETHIGGL
ncbi:hypothetical protein KI387_025273, partial [Taxus chinensis]